MDTDRSPQSTAGLTPCGCLLRLLWMGFGNAALIFATLNVANGGEVGAATGIFALVVAILPGARTLDVLFAGGLTTDGRRATKRDLARYVFGLGASATALYTIARAMR